MAINEVIFLGAGASASEGAPVQKDLFPEFFRSRSALARDPERVDRIRRFFRHFFGIDTEADPGSVVYPSFEEVFGVLEIAIDRGESFKGYSASTSAPDVQMAREDIIFLIALVLNRTLTAPEGHHKTLVQRLKGEGRLPSTAFISLNYDLLIDNALSGLRPDFDLDYGVDFTNYTRECDWELPRGEHSVFLYKLHGSLNWLYCPTCISLTLTPRERMATRLVEEPVACRECGMPTAPIITPPTYLKGVQNFFLHQIMRGAEGALRQVKRIVFCGYSFPDADLLIRYLMKRVELNFDPRPEIYVINEFPGKREEFRSLEENRYQRFFRDKGRVFYLEKTFNDFCAHGL